MSDRKTIDSRIKLTLLPIASFMSFFISDTILLFVLIVFAFFLYLYKLCVLYGSKDAVAYEGDMTLLNRCFYKNISQIVTYVLKTKKFENRLYEGFY